MHSSRVGSLVVPFVLESMVFLVRRSDSAPFSCCFNGSSMKGNESSCVRFIVMCVGSFEAFI